MSIAEYGEVIQKRNEKLQTQSQENTEEYQNHIEDKQRKFVDLDLHIH